jgi:cell division protein FtsQ
MAKIEAARLYKLGAAGISVAAVILIMALWYLSVNRKASLLVDTIELEISDEAAHSLINQAEMKKRIIEISGLGKRGIKVEKINLKKIEQRLREDQRIKEVQVYLDNQNRLHVLIEPRSPLIKITDAQQNQYYLDETGAQIPVYRGASSRVMVATGNITAYDSSFIVRDTSSSLRKVFELALHIRKDEFLLALVEQVYVEDNGDLVIVPKIGREKLIFGDLTQADEKLENLKIFYRDGLPKVGWNQYATLNLKFTNQVILGKKSEEVIPELADQTSVNDNNITINH